MIAAPKSKHILFAIGLFAIAAVFALLVVDKGDVVLALGQHHNPVLDAVFFILTHFGDLPVLLPALGLMFYFMPFTRHQKKQVFARLLIVLTVMFIVIIVLKQFVFNFDRPVLYFKKLGQILPEIYGMQLRTNYSFPSGHSATGFFAWYVWFQLMFVNKTARFYWFIPAITVAFSRVYLGQHFLQDIWAGSFIGFLFGVSLIWWLSKTKASETNSIIAEKL